MTVALSLITAVRLDRLQLLARPAQPQRRPVRGVAADPGRQRPLHHPARARARWRPQQRRPQAARLRPRSQACSRSAGSCSSSARSRRATSRSSRPIIGLEGGIAALAVFAFGERVGAIVVASGSRSRSLGGCLAASAGRRRTAAGALPAAGAAVCLGAMFALYAAAEDLGPVCVVARGPPERARAARRARARRGVRAPGPRRRRAPAGARRARRRRLRRLLVRRRARPRERRGGRRGAVLDAQRGGRDRAPARAAPAAPVRRHRARGRRDGAARAGL